MFKIGDRVEVISIATKVRRPLKIGMKGTVKLVSIGWLIGIEFDEYMGGHNGIWDGKDGYCWYLPDEYLKKIEESEGKE